MLILLIRLRTETASEHTLSCTPGQAGRTLNLFKLRGCQVGEESQTPTPRDGHDDDERGEGRPSPSLLYANLPRPGFSHDLVIASGILRRLVELLSRRARCRVGFPAWQGLRDGGPGSKQTLSKFVTV